METVELTEALRRHGAGCFTCGLIRIWHDGTTRAGNLRQSINAKPRMTTTRRGSLLPVTCPQKLAVRKARSTAIGTSGRR